MDPAGRGPLGIAKFPYAIGEKMGITLRGIELPPIQFREMLEESNKRRPFLGNDGLNAGKEGGIAERPADI